MTGFLLVTNEKLSGLVVRHYGSIDRKFVHALLFATGSDVAGKFPHCGINLGLLLLLL